jgi:hypothetical protein
LFIFSAAAPGNLLQLMMKASNGDLGLMDDVHCSIENPFPLDCPADEDYYAGVESQEDDETSNDNDVDEDNNGTGSNNEQISEIDDRINNEDFSFGRDYIYDSWELGIDDTDMNETEVDGDIGQDFQILNSFGQVDVSSEENQLCCFGLNGNENTGLVGGCGCHK